MNPYTTTDAYALPFIETLIDRVSQYRVFSLLDLRSSFHQIPLDPSQRQLTAFEGAGRLYEWLLLPFGLTNSGAVFTQVLGNLVKGSPGCFHYIYIYRDNTMVPEDSPGCFNYMDDIVVVGATKDEHDTSLARFLDLVHTTGIHSNSSKISFRKNTLTFLGHEISQGNIRTCASRLRPILITRCM